MCTIIFTAFFFHVQRYPGLDHKFYDHSNIEIILKTFFGVFFVFVCGFVSLSGFFVCVWGGGYWLVRDRVLLCSPSCPRTDYADPPASAGIKAMPHPV